MRVSVHKTETFGSQSQLLRLRHSEVSLSFKKETFRSQSQFRDEDIQKSVSFARPRLRL